MKKKTESLTLRVSRSWKRSLEQLAEKVGLDPERERASIVRNLVFREAKIWGESPYYSKKTLVVVYVTAQRSLAYWVRQKLFLIHPRGRLPSALSIKPECKSKFESETGESQWLLNYFGVHRAGQTLRQTADRSGVTTKYADLEINQQKDAVVRREVLAVASDYVQGHSPGSASDDRSDIVIDIPTLELEVFVVVDLGLYGQQSQRRYADVGYEIRNREFALFSGPIDPTIDWDSGRYPPTVTKPRASYVRLHDRARSSVEDLVFRVEELISEGQVSDDDGEAIVIEREKREALRSLRLPKEMAFGRLRWNMPAPNTIACVTWNKPYSDG